MIRRFNESDSKMSFSCDDIVCDILSKYMAPRDASWLQRNKSGLCQGDKVVVGEQFLGDIAHEYAIKNYGPQVANNVDNIASYYSPNRPLTIDLRTGRSVLPMFHLIASKLTWELDDLFRDIAEEIIVATDDYSDIAEPSYEYESMRRTKRRGLREGDASLKTNYAVIVYDMNTGSYNLYTGTKKMCEQLYKDLFDFNIDNYDDDEKEDMYDWLYGRLNEFNCIERIDFRRGIDYRDNYSDGYDKYHIINYTKPRHPISLYL